MMSAKSFRNQRRKVFAYFGCSQREADGKCEMDSIHPRENANSQKAPPKPKFLDSVRRVLRLRHYSIRTEESYVDWIRRFILFHGKRHPKEMGEPEICAFLTHLAADRNVAASTQNQALSALLFLFQITMIYTHVLNRPGTAVRSPLD